MFDNLSVVSTAVSSFNNAALFSPYFLISGILTIPLFFMVYFYGRDFAEKIGWTSKNVENQSVFWTSLTMV